MADLKSIFGKPVSSTTAKRKGKTAVAKTLDDVKNGITAALTEQIKGATGKGEIRRKWWFEGRRVL